MTAPPGAPGPAARALFGRELDELYDRIGAARRDSADAPPELLQDLETAYEELRVADEEVRAQQEQIAGFMEREHLVRWQQERIMSFLPVPALVTDANGVVGYVNAAAAVLLNMRVASLIGKPLLSYFSPEDRPALRRLMSDHGRDRRSFRHLATLVRRHDEPVHVECSVTALSGTGHDLSWTLLATDRSDGVASTQDLSLAKGLARIAALPLQHRERDEVLREAARIGAGVIGAGVSLSLTVGTPLEPDVLASTSPLAQATDGAQVTAGEGPCATAFQTGEVVVATDVRRDQRWPRLAPLLDPALAGVVALPLEVGESVVGALNVYTTEAFQPSLVRRGELLAATIAAVLHEVGSRQQLEETTREMQAALASRATIDQAKGIVMAHRAVGPDEAFAHLVSLSSSRHLKLRDVAAEIVAEAARRS
jgi:PAS domain S-box-containing protein